MTTPLHPAIERVTKRITERSADTRGAYLASMAAQRKNGTQRGGMGCANMAHTTAALPASDKLKIHAERAPHVGVITAYNDMLSAHQPYEHYPELIRGHARALGATAQVAGGVPAMCDGVTQGAAGMELSLFSRDVIALATAVGLSHNVFDAALMLGICDKIVPGLFIGSVQFGHLSTVFVPAGPMTSGLSNDAKAKVRQQYAQGLVGRAVGELFEVVADHRQRAPRQRAPRGVRRHGLAHHVAEQLLERVGKLGQAVEADDGECAAHLMQVSLDELEAGRVGPRGAPVEDFTGAVQRGVDLALDPGQRSQVRRGGVCHADRSRARSFTP